MKAELTETELAKLKAHGETISNLKQQLREIQKNIQKHNKQQARIAKGIRDRIEDCPEVPISEWDFSQVDWLAYKGQVIIPESEDDSDGNR